MQLITKAQAAHIPALKATEYQTDPMVWVKFFCTSNGWEWYITEKGTGEEEDLLFGLVKGWEDELGYICLSELEASWEVERDKFFTPAPLSTFRKVRV